MGKTCIYTKSSEEEWVHIFQLLKVESGPGERLCVMTGLRRGGAGLNYIGSRWYFWASGKMKSRTDLFLPPHEKDRSGHIGMWLVSTSWRTVAWPLSKGSWSVWGNFSTERKVARPNKPSVLFDEDTRLAPTLHLFSAATITSEHNLGGLEQGKLSLCPCRRPEA